MFKNSRGLKMVVCRDGKFICDNCHVEIKKEDNQAFTDNGTIIEGGLCLCEFCYLNLRKAW